MSAPAIQDGPTLEQLARGCRIAQKRYFADRSRENLIISKAAESLLDKALVALDRATPAAPMSERASGHLLNRTNPKGVPFIGTCANCGMTGLQAHQANEPCLNPANASYGDNILAAIEEVAP